MERRRGTDRRKTPRNMAGELRLSTGRRFRDRRESLRDALPATLRLLRLGAGRAVLTPGKIVDCSNTGIRLIVPFLGDQPPCRLGEQLLIELQEGTLPPLSMVVEIIWLQPSGNETLIGCQFQSTLVLNQLAILQRLREKTEVTPLKREPAPTTFHHSV